MPDEIADNVIPDLRDVKLLSFGCLKTKKYRYFFEKVIDNGLRMWYNISVG